MLDTGEAVVVTVTGELDLVNAPALRAELHEQLRRHPRGLVLELDVGFCASAGLQVIAEAATHTFERDIPFAVVIATTQIKRALEIGHLAEVVTIKATVAHARAWVRDQPARP